MSDAMKELEGHCDCYPDELCEWCQVRVDWFNRGKNNALDAVMEILTEVEERVKEKRKESPGLSLASAAIIDIRCAIQQLKGVK